MASRDFHSDDAQRECARAALALTALFDSEANPDDSRLAQSHLEGCAQCAWLWQSWTGSRYLLRRLPVPEVPPALLMRVLLAVRLMSFSKRGVGASALPTMNFEPQAIEARDARLLAETLLFSGANPFAPRRLRKRRPPAEHLFDLPPLDASLPQPPADLHALILNRTVGSAPLVETPVAVTPVEQFEIAAKSAHGPKWAVSKSLNAILLPVAAAWLFALAWSPQLAETVNPTSPLAETPVLTSPDRSETRLARQPVSPRVARKINREPAFVISEVMATGPRSASDGPDFVSPSLRRENAPVMETSTSEAALIQPDGVQNAEFTPVPAASPIVKPLPKIAKAAHFVPAISVAPVAWRERRATWSAPDVPTLDKRATKWQAVPRNAMPPAALAEERDEDDAAPDAAEIFDHAARLTDSRPDDVRDVMDDFHSSLLASTDEATATDEAETG